MLHYFNLFTFIILILYQRLRNLIFLILIIFPASLICSSSNQNWAINWEIQDLRRLLAYLRGIFGNNYIYILFFHLSAKLSRIRYADYENIARKNVWRARVYHKCILLSVFDICIPTPQCTFPPDCCRLSVRTRPRSLARTLHFQAGATSSPPLSSLVPSASLFYSHCLPLSNRPQLVSSRSFSLPFPLSFSLLCLLLC